MKRKILLTLGLVRPTLKEIREKYPFPYKVKEQKTKPIWYYRHIERIA